MTTTRYRITATYIPCQGILSDCNTPEVLGTAYGAVYEDYDAADDAADELRQTVEEYGLCKTTEYAVEAVD